MPVHVVRTWWVATPAHTGRGRPGKCPLAFQVQQHGVSQFFMTCFKKSLAADQLPELILDLGDQVHRILRQSNALHKPAGRVRGCPVACWLDGHVGTISAHVADPPLLHTQAGHVQEFLQHAGWTACWLNMFGPFVPMLLTRPCCPCSQVQDVGLIFLSAMATDIAGAADHEMGQALDACI